MVNRTTCLDLLGYPFCMLRSRLNSAIASVDDIKFADYKLCGLDGLVLHTLLYANQGGKEFTFQPYLHIISKPGIFVCSMPFDGSTCDAFYQATVILDSPRKMVEFSSVIDNIHDIFLLYESWQPKSRDKRCLFNSTV